MSQLLPHVAKEFHINFFWDVKKLWKLEAPIATISLAKVSWMFDYPFWDHEGRHAVLHPRSVKENPQLYSKEHEKVMRENLDFPISVLYLHKKWIIMDGLHRALKADILGKETIKTKKFYKKDIPNIKEDMVEKNQL